MSVNEEAVPTLAEQDIFLRWLQFTKATENYWDETTFGTKTSTGTVFGQKAIMTSMHVLGSAYVDMLVDQENGEGDVSHVRIKIFFNPLQNFQVYVEYGDADVDIIKAKPPTTFQPYSIGQLEEYIKDVVY